MNREKRPTASARVLLQTAAPVLLVMACSPTDRPWTPEGTAHAAEPGYSSVLLAKVPHVRQRPDFCGEACAEMALRRLGVSVSQDQFFALTGVNPAQGRGAYAREMVQGLRKVGFSPGQVWYHVKPAAAAGALEQQFRALHRDLQAGIPSIVCTRYDSSPRTTEHFRLVLGYDAARDEVLYHEPAEEGGAYRRMKRRTMLSLWPLKYQEDDWTVIRMRLKPERLTPPPLLPAGSIGPADLAQKVRSLQPDLPADFTLAVEPPFVVVGDGDPDMVRRYAAGTVRWSVQRLKRSYFARDPLRVITIWLLQDGESYRRAALRLTGELPDTPYGFYLPQRAVMVMNIATGGGTLVHEIVHPFVEANFPGCPSWFNEGLGSLYEQSSTCDGEICGLTNWRLDGLQKAIRAGRVPTFQALTATTSTQFYSEEKGINYAQARYLLYYLQEKGLLQRYYHRFVRDHARDHSGYLTLKAVLGVQDMARFQKEWERWVLALRFR